MSENSGYNYIIPTGKEKNGRQKGGQKSYIYRMNITKDGGMNMVNMRLEELLFCTMFIVVPMLGMVSAVIARILKQLAREAQAAQKEKLLIERKTLRAKMLEEVIAFKRLKKAAPVVAFADHNREEYHLLESQIHMPLKLTQLKDTNYPRAGP